MSLLHVLLLHVLLLQLSVRCSAAGRAALTMFRVSTGDDWVYIMQQCGVRPPVCTVSVSLFMSTCHHASPLAYILPGSPLGYVPWDTPLGYILPGSPLGYTLPAASHYDVQMCLVTHSCRRLTMLPTFLGHCILLEWDMAGWVRARMLSTLRWCCLFSGWMWQPYSVGALLLQLHCHHHHDPAEPVHGCGPGEL